MEALLRRDFLESLKYYPAVLYSAVLYLGFMLSHTVSLLTHGRVRGLRFHSWYLYGAVCLIVINFLVRNYLRIRFDILL